MVDEKFRLRTISSTEKASFKSLKEILNALNSRLTFGDIFCDSEKAFDRVNHDILFSELKFYGIIRKAYLLIKSFLKDRHQKVILRDNYNNHNT